MLIKWGSIIVDGSGKLGGHIFSKSRGGNTMRTLARAINPQTTFQQVIRSRFTNLSQNWRDLTESQRESWYAAESSFSRTNRFGDVVLLSGKNLYNSLNAQLAILGRSYKSIAPMPTEIPKNIVSKVTINMSGEFISIEGDFVAFTQYILVGTPSVSQGVRNFNDSIRIISRGASGSGGTDIINGNVLYTNYVKRFGSLNIGRKLFIGTYGISESGQRSPISMVQAVFA